MNSTAKAKVPVRRPRQSNPPPAASTQPKPGRKEGSTTGLNKPPTRIPQTQPAPSILTSQPKGAKKPSAVAPKPLKSNQTKQEPSSQSQPVIKKEEKVDILYPSKMENLTKINEELERKLRVMVEDKAKLEAASRREKKLSDEKIVSVEESAKVTEELLQEAQFQVGEMAAKIEEEERKVSVLEKRISLTDSSSKDMATKVLEIRKNMTELERKNSELTVKLKGVERERDGKELNEKKLANIIIHLEAQLKEASKKVQTKEENSEWKEKFLRSEEKLKMVLNKKKESHTQQICQLQDKMNAISSQAKEEIKKKEREIISVKEAERAANLKVKSLEDQTKSLLGSNKEQSVLVDKLEGDLLKEKENLLKMTTKVSSLTSTVDTLESQRKDLLSSKEQLIKSIKAAEETLCNSDRAHFSEVSELKAKYQDLQRKQLDELSRVEDSHTSKISKISANLEKTKVKLKVAEDINKKSEREMSEVQDKLKTYETCNSQLLAKLKDQKETIQSTEQEMEEMSSRCEEAERRLNEASNAINVENFQRDSLVSWKTRYEYQINYLTEKLRRVESGIVTPSNDVTNQQPQAEDEEEVDENEMYLKYLDTDTSEIINNLKTQVKNLEMKTVNLESSSQENQSKYEAVVLQLQSETEYQNKLYQQMLAEAVITELLNEIISDVSSATTQKFLQERIASLEHEVEVKEAEVLWVKSESEETVETLRKSLQEREEKESSEGEGESLSLAAFLQCGIIPDVEQVQNPSVKEVAGTELQQKVIELEKMLEEKEDHFFREIEVLKLKNSHLSEKLSVLQSTALINEGNSIEIENSDKVKTLEANLEKVSIAYEKLLQDSKQKEEDVDVLNVSLDIEKKDNEEIQRERDQLKQEKVELLGKIEAFQSSLESKVLHGTKKQELEVATLKSELERTKEKLKQAQEDSIKVHEGLFREHQEMLDGLRALPAKKRKRLMEDIHEKTKRLREDDDVEYNLLDDTLDGSINDPKENLAVDVEDEVLPQFVSVKTTPAQAPQVLMASWVTESE